LRGPRPHRSDASPVGDLPFFCPCNKCTKQQTHQALRSCLLPGHFFLGLFFGSWPKPNLPDIAA
jgi:hypothetical protein